MKNRSRLYVCLFLFVKSGCQCDCRLRSRHRYNSSLLTASGFYQRLSGLWVLLPSSPLCISVGLGILSLFYDYHDCLHRGGTWTTVLIVNIKVFAHKPKLHWPALLWFLSTIVSDIMITVVLVITLVSMLSVIISKITKCTEYKNKRKTGYTATDDVISNIIRSELRLLDWWKDLDCFTFQRLFRQVCWRMLLIFHVLTSPSDAMLVAPCLQLAMSSFSWVSIPLLLTRFACW